MLPNSLKLNHF